MNVNQDGLVSFSFHLGIIDFPYRIEKELTRN